METITTLDTSIELLQSIDNHLAQTNTILLFVLGCVSSIGVLYLLWCAIKKFF